VEERKVASPWVIRSRGRDPKVMLCAYSGPGRSPIPEPFDQRSGVIDQAGREPAHKGNRPKLHRWAGELKLVAASAPPRLVPWFPRARHSTKI